MATRPYRIGQIVPSSNTTMETEIPAMLRAREDIRPERFTFHSSRMRMHKVTKEELEAMNKEGLRCAAELADARVDVMSTACLVAIMAMGLGYHRQVQRELTEIARTHRCEAPVMTSAGALVEGLHIMGARRIALLAPYMCELTDLVVKYIENEGIEVVDAISFEIPDNLEVGRRDPASAARGREAPENRQRRCRRAVRVRPDAVAAVDPGGRGPVGNSRHVHVDLHDTADARSPGPRAGGAQCRRALVGPLPGDTERCVDAGRCLKPYIGSSGKIGRVSLR